LQEDVKKISETTTPTPSSNGVVHDDFLAGLDSQSSGEKLDRDPLYNLIAVAHLYQQHIWRLEHYARDAERDGDDEAASLFRRMQTGSYSGSEQCKELLRKRLLD
jgi:hypothetical protein